MGWRRWLGFAVLCGWQATAWLVPRAENGPSALTNLALGCLLMALGAGCVVAASRAGVLEMVWARIALAAAMSIGAPAVLLRSASEYSTDTNAAIVFALTPVAVVLMWSAVSNAAQGLSTLMPALVGAAGVLLVLPYELPVSGRAWWSLGEVVAAMVLSACGAVWLHRLTRKEGAAATIFIGATANMILLSVCGGWSGVHASAKWGAVTWATAAAQGVMVGLTLWLAGAISPVRFSVRFLMTPLLTIVEGAVLLRPGVDARLAMGVTLLLAGVGWFFAADGRVDEKVLSLR